MSWLSQIINRKTGLPEVDLRKGKGKDIVIKLLIEELISEKGAEVIKATDDVVLAALLKLCKDETRRRLDE